MAYDAITIPIALGIGQPALKENSIELCKNCYLQREAPIDQFGQPIRSISPYRIVPASALPIGRFDSITTTAFDEALNAVGAGRWGERFVFVSSNIVYVLTPMRDDIKRESVPVAPTTSEAVEVVAWSADICLLLINKQIRKLYYNVDGDLTLDPEITIDTVNVDDEYYISSAVIDQYDNPIPDLEHIIYFNDKICAIDSTGAFRASDTLSYYKWQKSGFTAARKPDEDITAMVATNNYVWTATAHTLTPHEDVGTTPFPFRSSSVFSPDVGVLHPHNMTSYDGVLYLRSSRGDLLSVTPRGVRRLSNQRIQELLNEDTHLYVIIDDARPMLCCSFGEGALVYNLFDGEQGWHYRDSFGKHGFVAKDGSWIISNDLIFGKLERYSLSREREIITAPMTIQNELEFDQKSLYVSGTFGHVEDPNAEPVIYFSYSDDGYEFSPEKQVDIGKRGQYLAYSQAYGHLSRSKTNKRSFKIRIPEGVPFQLTRLQAQVTRVQ